MYKAHAKIHSLPNNKILDWSKVNIFADDKISVTKKLKFAVGRVVNIAENGEDVCYQHFLLFQNCFQKPPSFGSLKVGIML